MRLPAVLLALTVPAFTATPAFALCFTIYNERDVAVYQSTEPPVDLSRRIGTEMARRYPRHLLVMAGSSVACPPIQPSSTIAQRVGAGLSTNPMDSPLFRNAPPGASALAPGPNSGDGASPGYAPLASNGRSDGAGVYVRPHTRSDGTVVQGHVRAAPGHGR